MNNDIKLEKNYSPEKMRAALFKMEQFFAIWQDDGVDEKHKKAAKALFEHYRRLALCILAKEFDPSMKVERILTPNMIDDIYIGQTLMGK